MNGPLRAQIMRFLLRLGEGQIGGGWRLSAVLAELREMQEQGLVTGRQFRYSGAVRWVLYDDLEKAS